MTKGRVRLVGLGIVVVCIILAIILIKLTSALVLGLGILGLFVGFVYGLCVVVSGSFEKALGWILFDFIITTL